MSVLLRSMRPAALRPVVVPCATSRCSRPQRTPTRAVCISGQLQHHPAQLSTKPSLLPGHDTHLSFTRFYAKGKNKGKNKGSKSGHMSEVSAEEMNTVVDGEKMKKAFEGQLQHLRQEFTERLTLRTTVASFDNLPVSTSDGSFPLIELGHVSQKGPNTVVIDLSAIPQYIPAVKTALVTALALNPTQDGTTLFVNIPKVTREHRETLVKSAKVMLNTTKVKLRDVQNKYLKDVKKVRGNYSEDLIRSVEARIQTMNNEYTAKAEQLLVAKSKELQGEK